MIADGPPDPRRPRGPDAAPSRCGILSATVADLPPTPTTGTAPPNREDPPGARTDQELAQLRAEAMRLRSQRPPLTYAAIANRLHIARSTAYRWANPAALEADRVATERRRQDPDLRDAERRRQRDYRRELVAGKRCARCGGPAPRTNDLDALCRSALQHQATAARILELLDGGTAATRTAIQAAPDPPRGKVSVFLRQLRAIGTAAQPGTGLAHRELVERLAAAEPVAAGHLPIREREAVAIAAGCLLALTDRSR